MASWTSVVSYFLPIRRLIEKTVLSGFVMACRLAICPTSRSPFSVMATTDGVVLLPSEFAITTGSPPSMTATQELVVPRSMPMTFAILSSLTIPSLMEKYETGNRRSFSRPFPCSPAHLFIAFFLFRGLRFLGHAHLGVTEHLVVVEIPFLQHLRHGVLRDGLRNGLHQRVVLGRVERHPLGRKRLDAELLQHVADLFVHQLHALTEAFVRLSCVRSVLERQAQVVHHGEEFQGELLIRILPEIGEVALHAFAVVFEVRVGPKIFVLRLGRFFRLLVEGFLELFQLFRLRLRRFVRCLLPLGCFPRELFEVLCVLAVIIRHARSPVQASPPGCGRGASTYSPPPPSAVRAGWRCCSTRHPGGP